MARILQAAATSSELSVSASTAGLSDTWLQPQPQYMRRSHSNSFLVADKVYVASVAPKSENNPEPAQYVFASSSDDSDFTVYPDPRGKTMDRGTEITLVLKPDALEYLENRNIITLVCVTILLTSTCMCSIVVFFAGTSTRLFPRRSRSTSTARKRSRLQWKRQSQRLLRPRLRLIATMRMRR